MEASFEEGAPWAPLETNGEPFRERLWKLTGNFLNLLWSSGARLGATVEEAFILRCDPTRAPQNGIDNGRLIGRLDVVPDQSVGFVIFRNQQKTSGRGTVLTGRRRCLVRRPESGMPGGDCPPLSAYGINWVARAARLRVNAGASAALRCEPS